MATITNKYELLTAGVLALEGRDAGMSVTTTRQVAIVVYAMLEKAGLVIDPQSAPASPPAAKEEFCKCGLPLVGGPNPWCSGCNQSSAVCDCCPPPAAKEEPKPKDRCACSHERRDHDSLGRCDALGCPCGCFKPAPAAKDNIFDLDVDDAAVKRRLDEAGIDMEPAYKRMREMIEKHKPAPAEGPKAKQPTSCEVCEGVVITDCPGCRQCKPAPAEGLKVPKEWWFNKAIEQHGRTWHAVYDDQGYKAIDYNGTIRGRYRTSADVLVHLCMQLMDRDEREHEVIDVDAPAARAEPNPSETPNSSADPVWVERDQSEDIIVEMPDGARETLYIGDTSDLAIDTLNKLIAKHRAAGVREGMERAIARYAKSSDRAKAAINQMAAILASPNATTDEKDAAFATMEGFLS